MPKINVTFDDFDPLLVYSDYTQWSTPNPQDHPTWYNASENETGVPWHEATIHYTTIQGASFAFNFTASSAWIYGASGPSSSTTNYTTTLDGASSSHTAENTTSSDNALGQGRTLLWSAQGLEEGEAHKVELRNEGSGVGVDLVVLEVDVGENTSNSTLDNTSPEISYTGAWDSNNGSFYGGSSSYTQGAGNEFSFNFTGSALYIYGDQVNDHGPYSIFFNASTIPYATYSGRSGCAVGGVEKSCEKLGTLKAFVGGLGEGEHQVRLVNEGEETYFDFDYLEYTTPSTYPSFILDPTCANGICASSSSDNTTTTAASGASGAATSAATTAPSSTESSGASANLYGREGGYAGLGTGLLIGIMGVWSMRRMGWA
ncbi:hypothetical protein C345_01954 [Cryptococcus neoformans A2-102-5]|nr:hypothetical protein C346_02086 [Cryptococcus neoformans var. grubii D17-1]OXG97580.1 hypothetical protein C345_01954 [Cryptococcus neoformans var. grubii A2-102-5]